MPLFAILAKDIFLPSCLFNLQGKLVLEYPRLHRGRLPSPILSGQATIEHHLDVSSLKELAKRWAPEVAKGVVKTGAHLALDDTRDSINELRHYREHLFK